MRRLHGPSSSWHFTTSDPIAAFVHYAPEISWSNHACVETCVTRRANQLLQVPVPTLGHVCMLCKLSRSRELMGLMNCIPHEAASSGSRDGFGAGSERRDVWNEARSQRQWHKGLVVQRCNQSSPELLDCGFGLSVLLWQKSDIHSKCLSFLLDLAFWA